MPYIAQKSREKLDDSINKLAKHIVDISRQEEGDGAFAGLLNYSCTRLALEIIRLRFGGHIRYWLVATVRGVFKDVSDEFYRRLVTPYEDKQIEKNGDVDLYQEFLKNIKSQ